MNRFFMCLFCRLLLLILAANAISSVYAVEVNKAIKVYTSSEVDDMIKKEIEKTIKKFKSNREIDLINEIMDKEKSLNLREAEIKKREEQFKLYENEFSDKLKKIQKDQNKIIGCISENKRKEDERIFNLIKVISNMRPAKAAEILSVQELDIAVRVFGQLDALKASKIFNSMDKEISARIQKSYLDMKK